MRCVESVKCETGGRKHRVGRGWNFPCYVLPNSVLFLALSVKHGNSVTFFATPQNFTIILQNPWHFHKMRKEQWKFRKFCVILFHQILQNSANSALKLWVFFCKILCYPLILWAKEPKFCNSVFYVNSVLSCQFLEFRYLADNMENSSPCSYVPDEMSVTWLCTGGGGGVT